MSLHVSLALLDFTFTLEPATLQPHTPGGGCAVGFDPSSPVLELGLGSFSPKPQSRAASTGQGTGAGTENENWSICCCHPEGCWVLGPFLPHPDDAWGDDGLYRVVTVSGTVLRSTHTRTLEPSPPKALTELRFLSPCSGLGQVTESEQGADNTLPSSKPVFS